MRKFLVLVYLMLVPCVILIMLWVNVAIHRTSFPESAEEQHHVKALLADLRPKVRAGLAERMQQWFPEGAPFTYALYGLSQCELAARTIGSERVVALREARWSLGQLASDKVKGRFPMLLPPDHGAFLAGWTAFLHGRLLQVTPAAELSKEDSAQFRTRCDRIAQTFMEHGSPFIPSYNGMAWPADAAVCAAALSLHDSRFPVAYKNVLTWWVKEATQRVDVRGMLPHEWDPESDALLQSARGSSMALMTILLPMIDPAFAADQFARFRLYFFKELFGVPTVGEHPNGVGGAGDIDSGPLLLGIGPAATIVAAGSCRLNADGFHAFEFTSTVDAFGMITGAERRNYLLGGMPIADLFIAWVRSIPAEVQTLQRPPRFLRFHAWSLLLLGIVLCPLIFRRLAGRGREQGQ
ncbi:MAG: hypothetical protein JNL52_07360 [Flavobacteriales bacterium]|nr:hypothetical protein [Flavobacteriales bacterium]